MRRKTPNKDTDRKLQSTMLTVEILGYEPRRKTAKRKFVLWIPGFGNPGTVVVAKDETEAKAAVAEFIGNELMAQNTLYGKGIAHE